jgi:hypothetical protein
LEVLNHLIELNQLDLRTSSEPPFGPNSRPRAVELLVDRSCCRELQSGLYLSLLADWLKAKGVRLKDENLFIQYSLCNYSQHTTSL